MYLKLKTLLVIIIMSAVGLSFQTIQNSTLTVNVTGIRNSNGEIEFALFSNSDGFGSDVKKAFKRVRGKITNGTCTVLFESIPHGQYAIEIYHDENNNKEFDETWYGMPKEGVAVSNNPSLGIFSPPKFETAKFNFDSSKNNISIKIKYL